MARRDIHIDVDTPRRKFERGLKQYLKFTNSEHSKAINRRLLFICRRAMQLVKKGSAAKIEKELTVQKTFFSRTKTGKVRRLKNARFVRAPRAVSIIQGKRIKRGEKPLSPEEAEKKARKMIAARKRAVGILRQGFSGIIIALSRAIGFFTKLEKGPRAKGRGRARPAKPSLRPVAQAEYRVNIDPGGRRQAPPEVKKAIAAAFRIEAKEMGRELAKRMKKQFKRQRA